MVAHARASSCVPPWCERLSELARASQHAADNVLALLATGRRYGSKVLYVHAHLLFFYVLHFSMWSIVLLIANPNPLSNYALFLFCWRLSKALSRVVCF